MFDESRIRNTTSLTNVEVHNELGSTNDRAIELIKHNSTALPAAIVTCCQTAGRGQRHRPWWSAEGSLTFSWLQSLPTHLPSSQRTTATQPLTKLGNKTWGLLPLAMGLAVAESIETISRLRNVKIKWPNDILIDDRKVAGILIESVLSSSGPAVVVGVGINVNNQSIAPDRRQKPENSDSRTMAPTSLLIESRTPTCLESLLIATLNRIDVEFKSLPKSPDSIVARCNERLAFRNTSVVLASLAKPIAEGICLGISLEGGIILQSQLGSQHRSPSNDSDVAESDSNVLTSPQRTFFSGSLRPASTPSDTP